MRRFIALILCASFLSFGPVPPLLADSGPINTQTQNPHQTAQGDLQTPGQFQQGRSQDQQQLQFQTALLNQISAQAIDSSLSFMQQPTYATQIGRVADFNAQFKFDNSAAVAKSGYLLVAFTPVGTTHTVEMYQQFVVNPGGSTVDVLFTNAQLLATGITPGRYLLSFAAFNAFDERLGGSTFGYYGNPLTIGDIQTTFSNPPVYTQQILAGSDFQAIWLLGNNGDTADTATLVTVITPVGTTDSHEFYSSATIAVGGSIPTTTVTAAQLAAAGITGGRYLVSFAAWDGLGNRLGGSTFGYYGNPLTVGTVDVGLPAAPVVPAAIASTDDLSVDFVFTNSGNAPDKVYAALVFTRPGETDPTASIEVYRTGISVPAGGTTYGFVLTAAQRAAAGIGDGNWLVSSSAFNGADARIASYFGNPLTIGTAAPSFSTLPTYPAHLAIGSALDTTWSLGNTGNAPAHVTMVMAITPSSGTGTVEFSRSVTVNAGGGTFGLEVTASELAAAGFDQADQYSVSFVAIGADGNPIGIFVGNLLEIGEGTPGMSAAPAYTNHITTAQSFTSDWTVTNTGAVSAHVSFLVVITSASSGVSKEFYQAGTIPVGGSAVTVTLSPSILAAQGIGSGFYTVAFKLFDANDRMVAQFFGNALTIDPSTTSVQTADQIPSQVFEVPSGADLSIPVTLPPTGSEQVSTVTALFAPAGGSSSAPAAQSSKPVTAVSSGRFDFHLTANELSLLNLFPGLYTVTFMAFDASGRVIGDGFFQSLVDFLFR